MEFERSPLGLAAKMYGRSNRVMRNTAVTFTAVAFAGAAAAATALYVAYMEGGKNALEKLNVKQESIMNLTAERDETRRQRDTTRKIVEDLQKTIDKQKDEVAYARKACEPFNKKAKKDRKNIDELDDILSR